jgi:hypothetical protein
MKKIILLAVFLINIHGLVFHFAGVSLNAQEACTDTIFPVKTKNIITECCIVEVKDANFVIYTKGGQNFAVEAKAIIKGGLYVPLETSTKPPVYIPNTTVTPKVEPLRKYKYDYELYSKRHRKGRIIATVGGFMAVTGIAMTIGSAVSNSNGNMSYNSAVTLATIGFFAFQFGVPIAITGLIIAKSNKKAMIRIKKNSLNLSLGISPNGVGLSLRL